MTPADVRDAAARLVERTCVAQGLPATITDPAALARMAAFMVPAAGSNHKAGVVVDASSAGRESPDRPASPHHRRRGAGSGSEAA
jgi:hypothetical protein